MTRHTLADEFIQALQSLFDWLEAEGVPGTSIGGVAVSLLAQPRVTQDIDAVIWLDADRWESFFIPLREKNTLSIAAVLGGLGGDEFSHRNEGHSDK